MEPARFFEEITLNICRSLDIARGMQACLPVLGKVMPADEIMLHFYDPDLDCIRLIARANSTTAALENRPVPLPKNLDLVKEIRSLPRTQISSLPGENRLNKLIMTAYGISNYSLAQMFLETCEQKYGLGHLTSAPRAKTYISLKTWHSW